MLVTHATKNLELCDKLVVIGRGGELTFTGSPAAALEFFGVETYDDIYSALSSRPAIEWRNEFERGQGEPAAGGPTRRRGARARAGGLGAGEAGLARPDGAADRALPEALHPRPAQPDDPARPGAADRDRDRLPVQAGDLRPRRGRGAAGEPRRRGAAALPARHHRDSGSARSPPLARSSRNGASPRARPRSASASAPICSRRRSSCSSSSACRRSRWRSSSSRPGRSTPTSASTSPCSGCSC